MSAASVVSPGVTSGSLVAEVLEVSGALLVVGVPGADDRVVEPVVVVGSVTDEALELLDPPVSAVELLVLLAVGVWVLSVLDVGVVPGTPVGVEDVWVLCVVVAVWAAMLEVATTQRRW